MFQSFDSVASPDQGPPRLAALRLQLNTQDLDGFLIPRADAHQGEYVAPRDDRLAWLTGFTGSAGFCAALKDIAGVFIDGRYRVQVKEQVASEFTPVDWPEIQLGDWLKSQLPQGGQIGFDPWLHSVEQIERLKLSLTGSGISLTAGDNLVDQIWPDQPPPPMALAHAQPIEYAGETHDSKRQRMAEALRGKALAASIITLPDSIAWLLNIRGGDIPRNPVAHGFAILHDDATVDLFMAPQKLKQLSSHLGSAIRLHSPASFLGFLASLTGPVMLDESSVPVIVARALQDAGSDISYQDDICALPKARKNAAEIKGSTKAHLRDGAAMCELLCWLDHNSGNGISEIDVVSQLESYRSATNALKDISFDTISGSGPNGAVIHYRVTHNSNRTLQQGDLLVLDSGGQYLDGTTDITRTIPIGSTGAEERAAFTRVLQGMIAISRLRWPVGLAGRDLEAVGRLPLWAAGQDFDHGIGHGVGAYLCVHEGPQRLSRMSHVPLEPGMILSNEPGYYREGAFGIRIENLVHVTPAAGLPGGDHHRAMLCFETLTYVPIDRRLIDTTLLTQGERDWLNRYHASCRTKIGPRLSADALAWLTQATAEI